MQYWKTIPPLKALLAVEATARLRSFTRAGDELNTSQSAVSHAVTQAETFLGTRLFDRSSRPVALTPEGVDYVETLTATLARLAAESDALRRRDAGDVLTISCNLAYGNYWLLPRLKEFHAACPGIQVNMVTTYQGLASLDPGIDVAIRFGRGDWPGSEARLLFREQILPVAAPGYLAEHPQVSAPEDLLRHSLLHARSADRSWYDWHQWFARFGVPVPATLPGAGFDNHLLMMQAALSGRGVALGWIGTATDFLRDGQLQALITGPVTLDEGLYAVVRNRADPRVAAFLSWVEDHTANVFRDLAAPYWSGI